MKKELEQELKVMRIARVVSDKRLKGSGLSRGDEVMVIATKDVAFKKDDPYLKRTLMVVCKVVDGDVRIPKDGTEDKAIVVDPRSLEIVGKDREDELIAQFNEKYNPS